MTDPGWLTARVSWFGWSLSRRRTCRRSRSPRSTSLRRPSVHHVALPGSPRRQRPREPGTRLRSCDDSLLDTGRRSGDRLMALGAKKEGPGQRLLGFTLMTTNTAASSPVRGRPVATSHAEIEQAAFRLYAERGFEGTTIEAIAAAVGVG